MRVFKSIAATHFEFAAIHFVAAGNIQGIKIGAAKTAIGRRRAARHRYDGIYTAYLVKYLYTQACCRIYPSCRITFKAVGPGVFIRIGYMQSAITLFKSKFPIRQYFVYPYPVRCRFCDI